MGGNEGLGAWVEGTKRNLAKGKVTGVVQVHPLWQNHNSVAKEQLGFGPGAEEGSGCRMANSTQNRWKRKLYKFCLLSAT